MAKDIRRFGAKGPAMGMLRLAREAGLYRRSMTTLCAAGKVIEKFAPMCTAKILSVLGIDTHAKEWYTYT